MSTLDEKLFRQAIRCAVMAGYSGTDVYHYMFGFLKHSMDAETRLLCSVAGIGVVTWEDSMSLDEYLNGGDGHE